MNDALLIEIGCEEIPARMIASSAQELGRRVGAILDDAALEHGVVTAWGGSRRLSVRVEDVQNKQADRLERVLGPPQQAAFDEQGQPRPAAIGFARKQGVEPAALEVFDTDRGRYVGLERQRPGQDVGEVLAEQLPGAVGGMSFPKTMRWGDGTFRWVRPVHWLLALHGNRLLPLELFGVQAEAASTGHRFLGEARVAVQEPDQYERALEQAHVVADPARRREILSARLGEAAQGLGGTPVDDPGLMDEVVDLVEWPGVVAGRFDEAYLELPRELLVTTLRHHQKCFSVQNADARLLNAFLAVANTERDPAGHIQRGNEWVVGGRLEDARFFWREDRRRPLAVWGHGLAKVTFHAKLGSYADKSARMAELAQELARLLGRDDAVQQQAREAAQLAKADLVTSLVGEFPELQGIVGGLLLRAEGEEEQIASAVYEHYRPQGPDDRLPRTELACVVAVADKLDNLTGLVGAGVVPKGSRDPFGLRRAANGLMRILLERRWAISLEDLYRLTDEHEAVFALLLDRLARFLQDLGYTVNEVQAVLRPAISATESLGWYLHDIVARLDALKTVRGRADFENLVDLTKRVDNILTKNVDVRTTAASAVGQIADYEEQQAAALELSARIDEQQPRLERCAREGDYGEAIEIISGFIDPVERFFEDVLVIDADNPASTYHRCESLARLKQILTTHFDIRELAGQADGS